MSNHNPKENDSFFRHVSKVGHHPAPPPDYKTSTVVQPKQKTSFFGRLSQLSDLGQKPSPERDELVARGFSKSIASRALAACPRPRDSQTPVEAAADLAAHLTHLEKDPENTWDPSCATCYNEHVDQFSAAPDEREAHALLQEDLTPNLSVAARALAMTDNHVEDARYILLHWKHGSGYSKACHYCYLKLNHQPLPGQTGEGNIRKLVAGETVAGQANGGYGMTAQLGNPIGAVNVGGGMHIPAGII